MWGLGAFQMCRVSFGYRSEADRSPFADTAVEAQRLPTGRTVQHRAAWSVLMIGNRS